MFSNRKRSATFVVAKSSGATRFAALKRGYLRNIEKSLIASLILALLAFRLATHLDMEKYLIPSDDISFDLIDVLDISPPVEPPPALKMEHVVEVPPAVEKAPDDDKAQAKEIIEQIEELLAEDDDATLQLASTDPGESLLSGSQMGLLSRSPLRLRKNLASRDAGVRLAGGGLVGDGLSAGDLDIGSARAGRRQAQVNQSGLDLGVGRAKKAKKSPRRTPGRDAASLKLKAGPGKILSLASSTFGTEDYKLWNKIISELDRLNKRRYGAGSGAIRRNRGGFVISFDFADGTTQEINWRNNGNIWIRVVGESKRTTNQELRQALTQLLRVSL